MNRTMAVLSTTALLAACGGGGGDGGNEPVAVTVSVRPAFALLAFSQPVLLLQAPADASRWFVVEQAGRVRVFDNDETAPAADTFIDIAARVAGGGERGLLGMAFHPRFAQNGHAYLLYTRDAGGTVSYLSQFTSSDGGRTLDPGSEQPLLTIAQDFGNHNGGHLAFGPDGYLYAAFGDGGSANDPNGRAQDTTNLLGTIIRIDVDGAPPYALPPGNPFAGNPPCTQGFGAADCPEIFAWGLRNPWRFSFDRATGVLWAGDVGQGDYEEIDRIEAGLNYGWREREGAHCNPNLFPQGGCATAGFTDPVTEYSHAAGQSVTGGYVYRGGAETGIDGRYFYGDFVTGRVFSFDVANPVPPVIEDGIDTGLNISSFGQGNAGEVYLVDYGSGTIHKIISVAIN